MKSCSHSDTVSYLRKRKQTLESEIEIHKQAIKDKKRHIRNIEKDIDYTLNN